MDKKVYYRGKAGTYWYNFTEGLAYALTYKPTPANLIYTPHIHYGNGKLQYFNTYCRKDLLDTKKPLMIYIHGGGWVSGITEMRNTYLQNYAEKGFYTASISYTYAPEKVFPEQLREICSAIDKIFDDADKYNYDTGSILLAGESAGGYYIFFMAALAADKSLASKLGIEFRHNDEFSIKAMVSHCGCVDLRRLLNPEKPQSKFPDMKMMVCSFLGRDYESAREFLKTDEGSLTYPHITTGFPPVFFTTASMDRLRFEGYDMMEEYTALGIPFASYEGTGIIGNHAWTIVTKFKKGRECLQETFDFILPYFNDYKEIFKD